MAIPVLLSFLMFTCATCGMSSQADEANFSNWLKTFSKQLGFDDMNDYFNALNSTTTPLDTSELLDKLTDTVEKKFETTRKGLLQLQKALKKYLEQKSNESEQTSSGNISFPDCCNLSDDESNLGSHFKAKPHFSDGCIFHPRYMGQKKTYFDPRSISKVMKGNKDFKWQYVALADGTFFVYPANKPHDCEAYDPRNRSWFVETSTVHPKDVVIVLDTSGSMEITNSLGKSLMQIVKTGAKMVVNTLNSNDKVGIVAFSDDISVPSEYDCCREQLAVATPQNKQRLNSFINHLQGRGLTNYVAGLKKAFQYFKSVNSSSGERDRILLFLSDGMPTVGGGRNEILDLITKEAASFNNSIIIMTFGIGKALQDENNRQLLMDIANYTEDLSHVLHPRGQFTEVKCSKDMHQSVANYYVHLHTYRGDTAPVFTQPYYDAGGLGYVMSLCLPVQNKGKFFGVTCIDIRISDLLDDIINFQHGEMSYAFLINNNGFAVFHPLLPKPSSLNEDVGVIDIRSLERDAATLQVIESMKSGQEGSKSFFSQRTVSLGETENGVAVLWVNSTYKWAPIKGSNFSVCIVFRSNDQHHVFPDKKVSSFVYHDYWRQHITYERICKKFNRFQAKATTVKFSPTAFRRSLDYKNNEETEANISAIVRYMEGKSNDSSIFQTGIRGSVNFTAKAGRLWISGENVNDYPLVDQIPFIWRYIATMDGVLQTYPGVFINKIYDPRQRPWFKRTLSYKGKTVFSRPYIDYWGAGYVITITKAICKNECSLYSSENSAAAVMAADISIDYMYEKIIQLFPQCVERNKCLVIDRSGYIILHDDFIYPKDGQTPVIGAIHVTVKEQELAKYLAAENILHARGCIDISNIENKYFWEMTENLQNPLKMKGYTIYSISGTNIFLITKDVAQLSSSLSQPCQIVKNLLESEVLQSNIICEEIMKAKNIIDCACTSHTLFNYCENTFDLTKLSDFWPTCIPDNHKIDMSNVQNDPLNVSANIRPCEKSNCGNFNDQRGCRLAGCKWCGSDMDEKNVEKSFCTEYSKCLSDYEVNSKTLTDNTEDTGIGATIITIIVIVVLLVLALFLVLIWRICQANKRKEDRARLIQNQVRASVAEKGKDNDSMMWNGMCSDVASVLPVISEGIPLEKIKRNSHTSSTSGSIHYLTQRVEALVHRLEYQDPLSAVSSKLNGSNPPTASSSYFSHPYQGYQSATSQSDVSRPNSFHYSLPRTISNSSVLSSPKSSSLPSSKGTKIISRTPSSESAFRLSSEFLPEDQVVILRPKPGRLRKMFPLLCNLTRSASEQTWPVEFSSQLIGSGNREPSERTCPNSTAASQWSRDREPSERSCQLEDDEYSDIPEEGTSNELNTPTSTRSDRLTNSRASSFRRRSGSRSSLQRRSGRSGRSRSLSSSQMSGESIRSFIRQCIEDVAADEGASGGTADSTLQPSTQNSNAVHISMPLTEESSRAKDENLSEMSVKEKTN